MAKTGNDADNLTKRQITPYNDSETNLSGGCFFFLSLLSLMQKPTTQTRGEWRPTSGEKKSRVARESLLAKHVFFVWFSGFSVTMLAILGCQGGLSILGLHSRV